MAFRSILLPWDAQPQEAVEIDWTNPLTRGLIQCIIGGHAYDLASGQQVLGGSNAGPAALGSPGVYADGISIPANACGGQPLSGVPGGIPPDHAQFTLLALQTLSSTAAYGTDITIGWSGEPAAGFYLGISFSTATFRPAIAGTNISHAVSLKDGSPHLLGVSLGGGTGRAWKDGVQVASAACSTPSFGFSQAYTRFQVGSNTAVAGYPVPTALVLLYDRTLWAAEHAQLAANPWQIFAPRETQIWVPSGAPAYTHPTLSNARMGSLTSTGGVPMVDYAF
ncbi:MAG TPA: hypothetical protein PKE15_00145 [Ottowia sp.]|nr:hypothetical protein [Ottowia sp.]